MKTIQAIDLWNGPYLEHHGVKGMKWGIRHEYQRALRKNETQYKRNIEKKLRAIRGMNRTTSVGRFFGIDEKKIKNGARYKRYEANAKKYDKAAKANQHVAWQTMGKINENGGNVSVKPMYQSSRRLFVAADLLSPNAPTTVGLKLIAGNGKAYANKELNKYGDTPLSIAMNRYKVTNAKRETGDIRFDSNKSIPYRVDNYIRYKYINGYMK